MSSFECATLLKGVTAYSKAKKKKSFVLVSYKMVFYENLLIERNLCLFIGWELYSFQISHLIGRGYKTSSNE